MKQIKQRWKLTKKVEIQENKNKNIFLIIIIETEINRN